MKAEHRKELETNELAKDTRLLLERVKSGRFVNYRVLGIVVAVVLVVGVWWYAVRQSRRAASGQWATFAGARTQPLLEQFVEGTKPEDPAGKVARLELARVWLGPEGIAQLRARETERKAKGVENIVKARDEFVKLADEFQDDKTLRAAALLDAAEAELALVGVPAAGNPNEYRGTVGKAAEFYRQAAAVVGEDTEYGVKLKERANKLEADREKVIDVAKVLYNPVGPTTDPLRPGEGVKPPTGPLPPLTPPANPAATPPAEAPKAPAAGAVTPPATTPATPPATTPPANTNTPPSPAPPGTAPMNAPNQPPANPATTPTPPATPPQPEKK